MNFLSWISENTAVIVLLISAVSIYLTFKTLRDQRIHNRISVKPIAHLSIHKSADKISIKLENRGIGPLIMNSFQVIRDGNEKSNLWELLPPLPDGFNYQKDCKDLAIPIQGIIVLIESTKNLSEIPGWNEIRIALSKITIKITYSDIYGKKMPLGEWPLAKDFG